jgi:hypothetical protein
MIQNPMGEKMKGHNHFPNRVLWTVLTLFITTTWAYCQESKIPDQPNSASGSTINHANPLNTYQFYLSLIIIVFGLLVITAQMLMLRRVQTLNSDDIARNCVITLVTTAALVLVIAGYDSAQIAPAFGLFGTVVGYLLGRGNRRADSERPTPDEPEGTV